MNLTIAAALAVLSIATCPALADSKKHKPPAAHGNGNAAWGCPPGLAKKSPPCVPPGQAKKHYRHHVGEVLRVDDYVLLRDPRRYGLDESPRWNYYRGDRDIYRVDRQTRRILAVLELADAFLN